MHPGSLVAHRLSTASSASAAVTQTISTNLNTIKEILKKRITDQTSLITAKFTQSVHLLASHRDLFADVLNPGKETLHFRAMHNDSELRQNHNSIAAQNIALEEALRNAFRKCQRARVLTRKQELSMELVMLECGMDMTAAQDRFYPFRRVFRLLRFGPSNYSACAAIC